MSLLVKVSLIEDNGTVSDITDVLIVEKGIEMKRGYKYEKEMLHWLDGGEIEQTSFGSDWETFDGHWMDDGDWQYRIAEKPQEEWWLYVNKVVVNDIYIGLVTLSTTATSETIGKIRMEDV